MTAPAQCANKNCNRALQAFIEGRLFQFEVISISLAANDEASAPFDEKPERETVLFWLCGGCASRFNVILEPARGLRLVPLGSSVDCVPETMARLHEVRQGIEC